MTKIERFEDIEAWKEARALTNQIYSVSVAGNLARDFELRDQLRRAAVSVMSNIAEGFERGGDKEFLQFLSLAKASCAEVRSHLYVALDQAYLTRCQFDELKLQTERVGKMLAGFMGYLRNSKYRGSKFRQASD
ncbi:MAG TPA: four helix bundle protein [Planctomycetaceae bacterium]|nr:four helix bundle protein [Planctomycetaceae bacterium]